MSDATDLMDLLLGQVAAVLQIPAWMLAGSARPLSRSDIAQLCGVELFERHGPPYGIVDVVGVSCRDPKVFKPPGVRFVYHATHWDRLADFQRRLDLFKKGLRYGPYC